jgi:hypothetical protein
MENGNRAMIAVSIGAILGGILFIKLAGFRWHLQVSGFWILAALFVAVGVSYVLLLKTRYFAAVIVLYSICSLFFNFGPNSSTFVVSRSPIVGSSFFFFASAAIWNLEASFLIAFSLYAKVVDKFLGIFLLRLLGIYRYRYRVEDAVLFLAILP